MPGPPPPQPGSTDAERVHELVPPPSTRRQPDAPPSSTSRTAFQTSDSEFEHKTLLFKAGEVIVPSQDDEKKGRNSFSSKVQYILAVVGMSVGLGNIWRFPAVAYENGGVAFLIPYLCMGIIFGLPMIYMDSSIGQFMQSSPSIVFKQYFPAAQGLGWTMAVILLSIGFFYVMPCGWSLIYICQLVAGRMKYMGSCDNAWNTIHCYSSLPDLHCADNPNGTAFFNGSCISSAARTASMVAANITKQSAPEEFFYFHIVNKHASLKFGEWNWMIGTSLFVCWALTALGLSKGVQSMGKVALVTTSLPYVIITILFFRGVTLEGASQGIKFFLTGAGEGSASSWGKILEAKTWKAALSQACFSLSIGGGSMIMMASYNKRDHPNYRDCLIIFAADTFMSVFGGTAVFAILGSMAHRMGVPLDKVVQSGLTLTFIAYPEATSHMPAPTLWALLFFIMMFVLGLSTMFAFVESLATCIIDEHPRLVKWHWLVVSIICAGCYVLNILCFTFQNGFHIFQVLNECLGSVSLPGALFLEILIVMTYYGSPRLFRDIRCMHGLPTNQFARVFGNLGLYLKITVTFTAPLCAVIMSGIITFDFFSLKIEDKMNGKVLVYPNWTVAMGFFIGAFPLLLVPLGALINYLKFRKTGEPTRDLFRISDDHPAVRYNLPDPVEWKAFFFPPLRKPLAESTNPSATKDPQTTSHIPSIPTIPTSG